jgi:membrane-associated phospholipid phosphatase
MSKRLSGRLVLVMLASLASSAAPAQETPLPPPDAAPQPPPPAEQPALLRVPEDPPFFKLLFKDMGHVLASPAHWTGGEWVVAFVTLGGAAGLSTVDDETYAWAKRQNSTWQEIGNDFEWMGDLRSIGFLGAFYVGGAIFHDSKAKRVCIDGLIASTIAAGVITPVIATGVGRMRPNKEEGAYKFRPFEGRSFPSGHVTDIFAVASVVAANYDSPVVKVLVYGGAAAGSWSRMRRGKHFLSDCLVGAVIGQSVGNTVVHYNRGVRLGYAEERERKQHVWVLPFVPEGGGFGINVTLID